MHLDVLAPVEEGRDLSYDQTDDTLVAGECVGAAKRPQPGRSRERAEQGPIRSTLVEIADESDQEIVQCLGARVVTKQLAVGFFESDDLARFPGRFGNFRLAFRLFSAKIYISQGTILLNSS